MGRQFTQDLKSEIVRKNISLDIALGQHLQYNHYPPVSNDFVPACKRAIKLANAGEWDKLIKLPNGKVRAVSVIIEGLHLDEFLDLEIKG